MDEIANELPTVFAPKVELTIFPPKPENVFKTPSNDSLEMADAQNARKACHFNPKNSVTGSIKIPILYKMLVS